MKKKNNNTLWALIVVAIILGLFAFRMGWLGAGLTIDPWIYDLNNDCYIDSNEAGSATNDWLSENIGISDSIAVINLYEAHARNPSCGGTTTTTIVPPCVGDECPPGAWVWAVLAVGILGITYLIFKRK